ncbi:hypothetical protein EN840_35595, partial [Mesorhizobium sp. M8A.F.Ca.ET.197.01.1.1]
GLSPIALPGMLLAFGAGAVIGNIVGALNRLLLHLVRQCLFHQLCLEYILPILLFDSYLKLVYHIHLLFLCILILRLYHLYLLLL